MFQTKMVTKIPSQQSDNSATFHSISFYLTLFNIKNNKEFKSRLGIFLDVLWISDLKLIPSSFPPFPHPFLPLRGREGWE